MQFDNKWILFGIPVNIVSITIGIASFVVRIKFIQ